ncbi:hypothetical protein t2947 [Salmonella enterica subsp. enterica serovar Typhi str. Ty2]|uniref:Uncharacterized protein n=1 Tax=Salmonella typhi TaxID=90370 RepID=A0A0H2VPS9_SALTI|nr:hypothetical protein t2947 [Salmonella enterica subsp. enterica serovar Typhi str. Ty2]
MSLQELFELVLCVHLVCQMLYRE